MCIRDRFKLLSIYFQPIAGSVSKNMHVMKMTRSLIKSLKEREVMLRGNKILAIKLGLVRR